AELTPVFQMRVDAAHLGELVSRPCVCLRHVRRTSKAWTDSVREASGIVHHMRMLQALFANYVVGIEVDGLHAGLPHLRVVPARLLLGCFRGLLVCCVGKS